MLLCNHVGLVDRLKPYFSKADDLGLPKALLIGFGTSIFAGILLFYLFLIGLDVF